MDKIRKILRTPLTTTAVLVLSAVLLLAGSIGTTRAALSYRSEQFVSEVELDRIGVALLENGKPVSGKDAILKDFLGEDKELKAGKKYKEELSVENTGTIDAFVRVTVYTYWEDGKGNKRTDLDPKMIHLGLVTGKGWTVDISSTTEERTVLYYGTALKVGEKSSLFLDSVTIDGKTAHMVDQVKESTEDGYTVITTTYTYDGAYFHLSAVVDGVQTHSGQEAVKSAWGRTVTVSGDTLKLG